MRRPDDRLVLVDVGDDLVDLVGRIAQSRQGPRHGVIDDRHRPAPDQLLDLGQPQIGLDARGVTIHHESNSSGRGQHTGLRISHPELRGELDGAVPCLLGGTQELGRHALFVDLGHLVAVHAQHPVHGLFVFAVACEGAHARRCPSGRGVGVPGHEGGDGTGPGPALVGVVGQAQGHEERAQVGVAQPQLAELARRLGDPLGRVVGVADQDLLGGEHHLDGLLEPLDVESRVLTHEGEQVEARQVARRVVE